MNLLEMIGDRWETPVSGPARSTGKPPAPRPPRACREGPSSFPTFLGDPILRELGAAFSESASPRGEPLAVVIAGESGSGREHLLRRVEDVLATNEQGGCIAISRRRVRHWLRSNGEVSSSSSSERVAELAEDLFCLAVDWRSNLALLCEPPLGERLPRVESFLEGEGYAAALLIAQVSSGTEGVVPPRASPCAPPWLEVWRGSEVAIVDVAARRVRLVRDDHTGERRSIEARLPATREERHGLGTERVAASGRREIRIIGGTIEPALVPVDPAPPALRPPSAHSPDMGGITRRRRLLEKIRLAAEQESGVLDSDTMGSYLPLE